LALVYLLHPEPPRLQFLLFDLKDLHAKFDFIYF